ncbi:hypothetical protein V9K67_21435 [Paraflavisolibacter sp. H34]|uniref:hypothetical protein n=1 Tax=Huijunlia imazamoxiresistens TaxID=3127457 RepID=UPI00301A6967
MDTNQRFHEVGTISGINTMVSGYRKMVLWSIVTLAAGFIICLVMMKSFYVKEARQVFVVKEYGLEKVRDKKVMVEGHVAMFLTKFFALDPSNYKKSTEEALNLIGNDGKKLYNAYKERQWFNQIVTSNLNINLDIESIRADMSTYPYTVVFESKMVVQRETNIQRRYLNGHCRVSETSNSELNPYGMMISDFVITQNDDYVEPKKRGIFN